MELAPHALYEYTELNNVVNRLLAILQTDYNRRMLSFVFCSLHNNCQDLRWRDETIARDVDLLVRVIQAVRADVANNEELRVAASQLKATLESRADRWSFRARQAG